MRPRPASIALLALLWASPALAQAGDPVRGESAVRKCVPCHQIGDAGGQIGPPLAGILDRPAAGLKGYNYSQAMRRAAAAGLVWTPTALGKLLRNPRALVPGTSMAFAGVLSAAERDDIIAYLATIPAP